MTIERERGFGLGNPDTALDQPTAENRKVEEDEFVIRTFLRQIS